MLKICSEGIVTHVYDDETEIRGISKLSVEFSPMNLVVVKMEMHTSQIEMSISDEFIKIVDNK